jgi:hypothetical protein
MEAILSSETSVLTKLHGVTFLKTTFFIVIAVKTLDLTEMVNLQERVKAKW